MDLTYYRAVNEREGGETLRQVFEAAGCSITADHRLVLDAGAVSLDGWDGARRIGYEFITTEAGDRAEFTQPILAELEARMAAGELFVFLVDEADIPDEQVLERAARRFLDRLRKLGALVGPAQGGASS